MKSDCDLEDDRMRWKSEKRECEKEESEKMRVRRKRVRIEKRGAMLRLRDCEGEIETVEVKLRVVREIEGFES